MPSSDARHKIIRSRDARRFLKDFAGVLNLSGVIQVLLKKTDEIIEISISSEAVNPALQHTVESEDFRLIYNYPPPENNEVKQRLDALLYAFKNFIQKNFEIAELSKHSLEKYRELNFLYHLGEAFRTITERQELMDVSYSLLSPRINLDFLYAVMPSKSLWTLLQPQNPSSHPLTREDLNNDALSSMLSDNKSRICNSEEACRAIWKTEHPMKVMVVVPMMHLNQLEGCLIAGRKDINAPFSSEEGHLLESFGFLFTGKLVDINRVEKMLKDERLVAIGNMANTIIHDFKNPMASIKAFAGMLGDFDFQQEERKEYSGIIINEVDRLVGMAEELLEFSRGETGRYNIAPLNIGQFTEDVSKLIERDFKEKGITFKKEIDFDGDILADRDKLKRVFINLAGNARDAMGSGGEFIIRTMLEDDKAHLLFADNGSGIPEAIRENLFEPFVTAGKKNGTGLGTAISKKIIEDMNGRIWFETETGRGTTFHVLLPMDK